MSKRRIISSNSESEGEPLQKSSRLTATVESENFQNEAHSSSSESLAEGEGVPLKIIGHEDDFPASEHRKGRFYRNREYKIEWKDGQITEEPRCRFMEDRPEMVEN